MGEFVKLILFLSVSGGLFALVLFMLKPFIQNRLSKSFQYYIWLVVLLRFMIPFSFGVNLMHFTVNSPTVPHAEEKASIQNDNSVSPANINPESNNSAFGNYALSQLSTSKPQGMNILTMLAGNMLWIWLAGALISATLNINGYLHFIRYMHCSAYAAEIPDCAAKVFKSRFAPTPMLVGVIKPRIYLPEIEYGDNHLRNILLHEITHMRRRDVLLKWFVALVVSVHWFNPIVYFMRREFNRACELACDEAVIQNLDSAAKQSYGDTLITVVAGNRYPAGVISVTMCEEKEKLKERLVAIMSYRKKTKTAGFVAAVLVLVIAGSALALGASIEAGNRNPETENKGMTIISQNKDSIHFHIDRIMPNEAIRLNKIELNNDIEYTLNLTSESGGTPFAALNESPDITSFHGTAWNQFKMNSSLNPFTTAFSYIDKETCYIYVGSIDKTITNVDIVLTHDYTNPVPGNNSQLISSATDSYSYLLKGGVAANNYQFGNPFPAKTGDLVKLSLVNELSGWQLDEDEIELRIVIGGNSGTTQEVTLSNEEKEKTIAIDENTNHHVTIYNDNNQLVNYNIQLTVKSSTVTSIPTNISGDQFLSNAWISYKGENASNVVLEFPSWYTEDMWNVEFIWGDYAVIPIGYNRLDDKNSITVGVGHDTHYELKVELSGKESLFIDLRELEKNLR